MIPREDVNMDEANKSRHIQVLTLEIRDQLDHVVAAVGLMEALTLLYVEEGVVNVGSWKHVTNLLDRTATWLDRLDNLASVEDIPF